MSSQRSSVQRDERRALCKSRPLSLSARPQARRSLSERGPLVLQIAPSDVAAVCALAARQSLLQRVQRLQVQRQLCHVRVALRAETQVHIIGDDEHGQRDGQQERTKNNTSTATRQASHAPRWTAAAPRSGSHQWRAAARLMSWKTQAHCQASCGSGAPSRLEAGREAAHREKHGNKMRVSAQQNKIKTTHITCSQSNGNMRAR